MAANLTLGRATVQKIPEIHETTQTPSRRSLSSLLSNGKEQHRPLSLKGPSRYKRWSAKTKAALHIRPSPDPEIFIPAATLAPLPETKVEDMRIGDHLPDKTTFKDFIHNPIDVVTSAVKAHGGNAMADEIMNKEVSHGHDVQLVKAHDELEAATTEAEKEEAEEKIEHLENSRQALFVRWALDRHVMKIRKFEPKVARSLDRHDFIVYNELGQEKMQWSQYLQQLIVHHAEKYGSQYIGLYAEPGTPDKDALSAAAERLIISSAPYQELFVKVRSIYRWEDPTRTSMYLGAFLFLWTCDFLVQALILTIICCVVQRRFSNPSIDELRQQLIRVENADEAAMNLMEHMEKHGAKRWTETVVEQIGPRMMLKLGDTAALLETFMSFYEWRDPIRTTYTLCILASSLIFITVTPAWLLIKLGTLSSGFCFFALFPISSRYWEYRFLVSPVTWLFWNIPSHPEWAVAHLEYEGYQQKIKALQQSLVSKNETTDTSSGRDSATGITPDQVSGIDLAKYACACKTHQGKLIIGNSNVRFETITRGKEMWRIPYTRLRSVEKVQESTRMRSGEDLLFTDIDGETFKADDFKKRNEVFAQVLGYSGIKWQIAG